MLNIFVHDSAVGVWRHVGRALQLSFRLRSLECLSYAPGLGQELVGVIYDHIQRLVTVVSASLSTLDTALCRVT